MLEAVSVVAWKRPRDVAPVRTVQKRRIAGLRRLKTRDAEL